MFRPRYEIRKIFNAAQATVVGTESEAITYLGRTLARCCHEVD